MCITGVQIEVRQNGRVGGGRERERERERERKRERKGKGGREGGRERERERENKLKSVCTALVMRGCTNDVYFCRY